MSPIRMAFILLLTSIAACGPSTPEPVEPVPEPGPGPVPEERPTPEPEPGPGGDTGGGRVVIGEDPCATDADCVPAACCHPAACVARPNAPNCTDVMCTMECRYGTLDCGGGCLCREGRCAARLSEPPSGLPPPEPAPSP